MDFSLKQWRNESEQEEGDEEGEAEDQNPHHPPNSHHPYPCALPLFSSEPNTNLSVVPNSNSHHPNMPSANKFPRMGSYFSSSQWQELELQALIFRHMTAGASVPPELLHLVKKSLANTPYYHYYQPSLMQSGYWGRSGMDPEPGRCRRTDGKKWRCSRDVVAGQKYCERHMHRGRNRSRKPVESPTSLPYAAAAGETLRTHYSAARQGAAAGTSSFTLTTTTSHSSDLLHMNHRACNSVIETKRGPFEPQDADGQSSGRTLRHFFDDWPKPIHDSGGDANYSDTNLSIFMAGNPPSDIALQLGTGGVGGGSSSRVASGERDDDNNNNNNNNNSNSNKNQVSWGMAWENNNPVAPMGGPLAEALRSSVSNSSSPTSVLHRLARGSVPETSFVTL